MESIYSEESLSRTRVNYCSCLEQLEAAKAELEVLSRGVVYGVKLDAARKRVERLQDLCGRYRVLLDLQKSA